MEERWEGIYTHTHAHKRDRLDQSQTAAVLYSTAHSREPKRGNVYKPYMCVYICCDEKTPLVLFYLFEECARFINIFLLIVIISIEYYLTSYIDWCCGFYLGEAWHDDWLMSLNCGSKMANIKKIKTAIRVLLLFIFQPTKTFGFLLGSCSFSLISSLTVCKLCQIFGAVNWRTSLGGVVCCCWEKDDVFDCFIAWCWNIAIDKKTRASSDAEGGCSES